MKRIKKIKVLIVDDSLMFRETISRGISIDNSIEVVATAVDPFDARDKIIQYKPDVITLDVEMPKMDGLEFLRRLMPQYPMPVVVVSSVDSKVFDAMKYGAVDFVVKPNLKKVDGLETFIDELIVKIKIASSVDLSTYNSNDLNKEEIKQANGINIKNRVIAIGSSTGGTEAVSNILKKLPKDIPPILIVQHMPPVFTKLYANRLNSYCKIEVREAKNMDRLNEGLALIAPGEYHMEIKKDSKGYYVKCHKGKKVSGHCPSVDVLFNSVAENVKGKAIGVILTGMGYDGAKGLKRMRDKGAFTIGQNKDTCIVYGMPKVAYEIGAVKKQVALNNIPYIISTYLKKS
jgi:two-component system chemotaxis response regulator CheB